MIRFEDIQEKVETYMKGADLDLLRKAYVFSAKEHKGQTRSSGEPYLTHPLSVAFILADLKLDLTCIVAGLLHDVLEDRKSTRLNSSHLVISYAVFCLKKKKYNSLKCYT